MKSNATYVPTFFGYIILVLVIVGEQGTEEEARIEKGRKTLVTMLVVEDNFQNLNLRLGIQTEVLHRGTFSHFPFRWIY